MAGQPTSPVSRVLCWFMNIVFRVGQPDINHRSSGLRSLYSPLAAFSSSVSKPASQLNRLAAAAVKMLEVVASSQQLTNQKQETRRRAMSSKREEKDSLTRSS